MQQHQHTPGSVPNYHLFPVFSSVWLPEWWRSESWRLLSELTASSSVWPPAADVHLQPRLWVRPEVILQQRPPGLQLRNTHFPEGPPTAAGLHHGLHRHTWRKSVPTLLTCVILHTEADSCCFSGAWNDQRSIRSFSVSDWRCQPAADTATILESRGEKHVWFVKALWCCHTHTHTIRFSSPVLPHYYWNTNRIDHGQ